MRSKIFDFDANGCRGFVLGADSDAVPFGEDVPQ